MLETQQTIARWAETTFGPATNLRVAVRANQEMAELLTALAQDEQHPEALEEIADIYITLCRVAESLGDLQAVVQDKMSVNRARTWKKDFTGCGQHVE